LNYIDNFVIIPTEPPTTPPTLKDRNMDKKMNITADNLAISNAQRTLSKFGKRDYRGQIKTEFKDDHIKGLKLSLIESSQAPNNIHIKLYSIAEIKGKKHRYTWYDNTTDKNIPTPQELAQIKANAQAWHTNKINNKNFKVFYLSDFLAPYINSHNVTNTQKSYKQRLNKFSKFMNEKIENINHIEVCSHIQKIFPDSSRDYISVFCTFLDYVWKKTDSEPIFNLKNKIKLFAPKKNKSTNHFKTIESMDNEELTEKLIQGFTKLILNIKNPEIVQQVITRFLFPLRFTEIKNIKPNDILKDRIIIRETKTTQNFLVPLSHQKAREQLIQHPITIGMEFLNRVLKKHLDLSTHSTRSIFDTYFSRTGKYQSNYIEACLSHKEKSAVILAYRIDARNYYFTQRIPIMKDWYDFIFDCFQQAQERAKGENVQKINA